LARALFAALALLMASASFSPSHGEETRVIKLGYILAPHSQLGAGADVFAAEVEKRTQGRYRIDQYPDAALGGEVEMMKGVQLGTVDMAFITGAPMPNFVPEIGVFGIPFLIRDAQHAYAVLDGPLGQELLKKFEAQNIVALAWGENGMRHITNSRNLIRVPTDLNGLKLRVPQSDVMVEGFDALGADTHPLAFPEVYGALQTGRFDGQENPIATIIASKFYQVQKYLTLSGHIYDPAAFLMSKDLYVELSPADRQAFVEAARLGLAQVRGRGRGQWHRVSAAAGHAGHHQHRQGEVRRRDGIGDAGLREEVRARPDRRHPPGEGRQPVTRRR
jgi:tripartite ATP-independent transporter DctP family solute receptor